MSKCYGAGPLVHSTDNVNTELYSGSSAHLLEQSGHGPRQKDENTDQTRTWGRTCVDTGLVPLTGGTTLVVKWKAVGSSAYV